MAAVTVIGSGPAGMMAAGTAAGRGHRVVLLEKNPKLGRKLNITGKGRCNVTNDCGIDEFLASVNVNARFLYSAYSAFSSADVMAFFEGLGVPLKTERGRRVFPVSERAFDITDALGLFLQKRGVKVITNAAVTAVETDGGAVRGARVSERFYPSDAVIVATGGLSYPSTGSTGDGYRFARAAGHDVTPLYPSLVPLIIKEEWAPRLEGLTLKNAGLAVKTEAVKKPLYAGAGELLFTRDGVSGPLALSASRFITGRLNESPVILIDLKPALSPERLDGRILRDFNASLNKSFINILYGLLPKRLAQIICELCGVPPERRACEITKAERHKLAGLLKQLVITPAGTAGYDEAVITAGGVDVRGINPSTMMSKKIKGLHFAGEVLDADAMTGGYNLQIAFSTGYLAGMMC